MKRVAVKSSNIQTVSFTDTDKSDDGMMEITFSSGKTYRYFEVPYEVFDSLCNAESPGSFFAHEVKGHYEFEKVESK